MNTKDHQLPIPANAQALSSAWLTAALCQSIPGVTVTAFQSAPLAENQGFFGSLMRIELDYAKSIPDAPRTLIAKFSSATPAMRLRSVDSYEREVRFYQQLAPSTELPTPRCYYADINLATGDHIILLQDLTPLHSGSRVAGCTPVQARIAIHHVAQLHTTWWGRTEGEELAWLRDGDLNPDAEPLRQAYEQWWPAFYEQAQAQLPASLIPFSQHLGNHRATLRKALFGAAPRTLIHRDYQLENLFFGAGQGSGLEFDTEFAIVDWQFFSRGRCVWDVAYFLSESLLPDVRRAVEMELLAMYHQSLVEHGIGDYTFEQCLYDYRLCLLQRHTALVSTIAAMPFSEEQRHIHINILLPRNIAAILDHDAHKTEL